MCSSKCSTNTLQRPGTCIDAASSQKDCDQRRYRARPKLCRAGELPVCIAARTCVHLLANMRLAGIVWPVSLLRNAD